MKRGVAVALLGLIGLAGGCGTPARFVEKYADGGTVAIPSNTNDWPSYNRREALALIQQHVGPNFDIIEEREFVSGHTAMNNTHVNSETVPNPLNRNRSVQRTDSNSTTTARDLTEWRITYRRTTTPITGEDISTGVVPASGTLPDVIPSVQPAPTVREVGNPTQRWTTGTGSHTSPGGLRQRQ